MCISDVWLLSDMKYVIMNPVLTAMIASWKKVNGTRSEPHPEVAR